jgi:hypothetical protein
MTGIPFMITHAQKEALHARGLSDEEIARLTPQRAHEILTTPDAREVREFIATIVAQARAATKHLSDPGILQITLIHPLSEKVETIYRYELNDLDLVERMTGEAVSASKAGHNVYIEARTVRRGLDAKKRGEASDTVAVFALVVDSDADKDEAWTPTVPVSLTVETSPGNAHCWFFLERAVDAKAGKALGDRMRVATKTDKPTGNVCQPYRVAGTVNYPSEKKKTERGRVATWTRSLGFNPKTLWTPEQLEQAFPKPNGGGPREPSEELQAPIERIAAALAVIPRNDNDEHSDNYWTEIGHKPGRTYMIQIGMAVKAASGGSVEGLALFDKWRKGAPDYNADMVKKKWEGFHPTNIGFGTLKFYADKARPGWDAPRGVSLRDFFAYMPMHSYIYAPARDMWPAGSVNARVLPIAMSDASGKPVRDEDGNQKMMSAAAWLDRNKPVEQMTWAPGEPMIIRDRLISEGGWLERNDVTVFNLYRPPTIVPGNAAEADRWLDHIHKVYPDDAAHIVRYLAHRVQRPHEKINHALVLGGLQGIGKDTLLEPAKRAVGPWNFHEVSPQHMLGRFNGFLKSVILRVNEARDLGEVNRFQFYDHMKAYTAAPPDVLRVDEKNLREYSVLNCCGVVITTNHKADGIYLPADDRRHYVAWSDLTKDDFVTSYWTGLWTWYNRGGARHVAAYLAELDLSKFDPKAPPPKTPAFWDIVDANRAPEESELADILDRLKNPPATTLAKIVAEADEDLSEWLKDRRNRRVIPHRLERCGYVSVRNDAAKDGLWKLGGARQVVYARTDLSLRDRLIAAKQLAGLPFSTGR